MDELIKSVSGIRGIYGKGINPVIVGQIASHFGIFQKSRLLLHADHKLPHTLDNNPLKRIHILVGRDSRTTGDALAHAVISGLLGVGVNVIWLGIVATPTLLYNVKEMKAAGGICLTASHNPAEWNALKLVDKNGMFFFPEVMHDFLHVLPNKICYSAWDEMGEKTDDTQAITRHIQKILALPYLAPSKIQEGRYKVVLDSVNGAGGLISPILLKALGCEVVELNSEPTGFFAHNPEPLAKNLAHICQAVKDHQADIGFATDPDVDRLAIINEKGEYIGEEYSLLLAEKFILTHNKGDIVTNLSSSMATEDLAREFGVQVFRTAVGEINVGKKMIEIGSPIGGEGNGGIICSDVQYTRDAITGMALILGLMAQTKKQISELSEGIPKYFFAKAKILATSAPLDLFMYQAEKIYQGVKIDKTDGIKIILDKAWIHIRKSGTEPIIRVYVEAETQEKADNICTETIKKISKSK